MANFRHNMVGLHHVPAYQISGIPFMTGSTDHPVNKEVRYKFPRVARSVTVINLADNTKIRVHFHSCSLDAAANNTPITDGTNNVYTGLHYLELDSDEDSFTFNVKCNEIYISVPSGEPAVGVYSIYAELTAITASHMYHLTGSGIGTLDDGLTTGNA